MSGYHRSLITVAIHTLTIYLFIVLWFRLLGRRQVTELTTIEFIVVMLLGSSVETAMIAGNTTLLAGLVSAGTLFLADRVLTALVTRWNWLRTIVVGQPLLLVSQGQFVFPNLRRAGLTPADVREAIRERGFSGLDEVRLAVREIDGSISVVPWTTPIYASRARSGRGHE
ncbi:MAG TPA: YetF domain-containing protein [Chloroflexota bacterium]|nr:YetF domain-containing protein [Chloroflexota bacterium]